MAEDIAEYYEGLGINLFGLACGCAVKVSLVDVVYPALERIRPKLEKMGIILSRREDADIFRRTKGLRVFRRVYNINSPVIDELEFNPERAIAVFSVQQRNAFDPEVFAEKLLSIYVGLAKRVDRLVVGKGHSIVGARSPEQEVAVLDFIRSEGEQIEGYTLANNCTVRMLDPTDRPSSPTQVEAILSNSLNDLFSLGVTDNIRIYPLFDMPKDELLMETESNIASFCKKYGFSLKATDPLGIGDILMGATVIGETSKEVPAFKSHIREGDRILIHRPVGDLAPINLYLAALLYGEEYADSLGFSLKELERAKNMVLEVMREPNLRVARIISEYCPEYSQEFDESRHIKETTDLSGPGIYVFKELAEAAKVDIRIDGIPLMNEEIVRAAVREFLMPNGTTGTNGAIAIIASEEVIENVYNDLRSHGYRPEIIGTVLERGDGRVFIPADVAELVSAKSLLDKFEVVS